MVCHHLAKLRGHRCCSGRDMLLVCQVIKEEDVIKGSGDYNDRDP